MFVAIFGIVACDEGPEDADRVAEDLELDEDEDLTDDELELVEAELPPAPVRTDGSNGGVEEPTTSFAADTKPQGMRYECGGDAEEGTLVCCTPSGMYGVPVCWWWNPVSGRWE